MVKSMTADESFVRVMFLIVVLLILVILGKEVAIELVHALNT